MFSIILLACQVTGSGIQADESVWCDKFEVAKWLSKTECSVYTQQAAAKWAGDHPKWTIQKIICTDKPAYVLGHDRA